MAFRNLGTESAAVAFGARFRAARRAGEVSTTSATSPRHAAGALSYLYSTFGPAARTPHGTGDGCFEWSARSCSRTDSGAAQVFIATVSSVGEGGFRRSVAA